MGDTQSYIPLWTKSPFVQLYISLLVVIVIGFVLFTALFLAGTLIFGTKPDLIISPSHAINSNEINFLRYILISQHISLFIVPALILLKKLRPIDQQGFPEIKIPEIKEIGLVVILAFCLFPLTGVTGQLNSEMHLPERLSWLENWMREKENNANTLIERVMTPSGFEAMLLNLFMIALLPALGEELIFRGVFQRIFQRMFRSGHIAVWLTAFFFSFLHFQFFGFVPRFILGLVFGYLFLWSRTLWIPVIAHFVNNAVPAILAYLFGWEKINTTPDIPLWKQLTGLPIPILVCLVILFYFRNKSKRDEIANRDLSGFQISDHIEP